MNKKDLKFLKEIVEAPSPSGYEQPVAQILRDRLKDTADSITTDLLGSVHATLKGTKKEGMKVLLAAHIDELGLMAHYIDENGFIYFKPVGGIDAAILPGLRVDMYATGSGKTEKLRGVLGRKPIHLITPDERKDVTPSEKLFIDLGLPAEEVKKRVRIGDVATYGVGFEEFGDGMAISRAFDDQMGAWIAARVMEEVKAAGGAKGDLVVGGTVMEEIGLRGGQTTGYAVNADVSIALEVGHATDYPSIEKSTYGEFKCGDGPIIARGPNINPVLFERLVKAAEKAGVPYQIGAENRGTGTDINAIQLQRGGKVTGLISVPLRYMHTPTEVLALKDLEYTVKLLTQFVVDLEKNVDFTPQL